MGKRHGLSKTHFYHNIWWNMISRCKSHPAYKKIRVPKKWETFIGFKEDMYDVYHAFVESHNSTDGIVLSRRDKAKMYSKTNCYFTVKAKHLHTNKGIRKYHFDGKDRIVSEIAELTGVSTTVLNNRLSRGMDIHKAILTPYTQRNLPRYMITINGETKSFKDWSKTLKISTSTLHYRFRMNKPPHIIFGLTSEAKIKIIEVDYNSLEHQANAKAKRDKKRKAYYDTNRDALLSRCKAYHHKHRDEMVEKARIYRQRKKEEKRLANSNLPCSDKETIANWILIKYREDRDNVTPR